MRSVEEFLLKHNASVDENNRLYLSCLCDGTANFLMSMVNVLEALGCTDITTSHDIVTDGVSEDKPWCNCLFNANGLLPKGE